MKISVGHFVKRMYVLRLLLIYTISSCAAQ